MPRNGSGVYSADWVNASPNTTIESAKQNAMVADLVADANAARPVTAGGTGETTARLKDGTWRFQNTADTTKLLAFDLSGLTTATTRTLTVADGSGTIVTSGAMALSDAAKLQVRTNIGSPWLVSYDSGEQTITSGGFLTLTHGLGGVPSLLFAVLRCKTAEYNYAVGDEIPALINESADWGCIPVLRSGTIVILYGTKAQVFVAKDTSSRSGVLLTNANWRLIVRAYL